MIIETLDNAAKYSSVHPLFAKAFEFLYSIDLKNVEVGKYEISEGLNYVVVEKEGMTSEESTAKFECHNKHIDIQLCIRGKENLGWKPRNDCKSLKAEYNAEKDVLFYNDSPDTFFELTDNQFVIFFPEDVHAPMIADGIIKKLIVKVRI